MHKFAFILKCFIAFTLKPSFLTSKINLILNTLIFCVRKEIPTLESHNFKSNQNLIKTSSLVPYPLPKNHLQSAAKMRVNQFAF